MPLSNLQPFKLIKTKKETDKIGLSDIQGLRRLLEAKNRKDLSVLLKDCTSYLEESSQYGSYLFSVISTFWIYVPPEKIERLEQISQEDKNLLLELVRKIYPPKNHSPEITEVKFRVLTENIGNREENNIKKVKINLGKSKRSWFSMSNPFIYLIIATAVLVIAGLILNHFKE
jgi:hypothetical protein